MAQHSASLRGYARHCHQDVTVSFPHHYGRRSIYILYDGACIGYEGLIFGQRIDFATFGGKYAMDISRDFRVVSQFAAEDAHQSGLSDIVLSRTQAAGGDYDVGGVHGAMYRGCNVGGDVTHDVNSHHGDAQRVEAAGNVARIGVGDASQQDFVADNYDVSFH